MELIAGLDEAGRGPLAGPVIAAAVILENPIAGLADSKILSPSRRERLAIDIRQQARGWAIGRAEAWEIDQMNILQATLVAMERAVMALLERPDEVLVDGNRLPRLAVRARAIVNGDATIPVISAASIIAKVTRDAEMVELDQRYPGYGLATHKGYPTRAHVAALEKLGPSPIHRRSFAPVRRLLRAG